MTKEQVKENFGKRVESRARFEKKFARADNKEWKYILKPVRGILIGTRTYKDAKSTGYPFFKEIFIAKKIFEVALIVPDWRRNPVPVPLEDCKLL